VSTDAHKHGRNKKPGRQKDGMRDGLDIVHGLMGKKTSSKFQIKTGKKTTVAVRARA